jgi:DNA/RNA endonuclease YhcR with UshA esterase domain
MYKVIAAACAVMFMLFVFPLPADEAVTTSIADLYKQKDTLNGKQVTLKGEVVKVNNRIMQRNFIHLQDGTGTAADGTNDVTITSQDTANVGDQITVTGTLILDHDFGAGYKYPLLVEKATIHP